MKKILKRLTNILLTIFDFLAIPIVFLSSLLLFLIRRIGVHRTKFAKKIFYQIGVFPIIDHLTDVNSFFTPEK